MNNYRNGIMRRMRVYTKAMENTVNEKNAKIEGQKDLIGCTLYDRKLAEINSETEQIQQQLKSTVVKDLSATLQAMREIASQRTTKPPTAENVSTLQILGMLDTITPTQMRLYAEQMSDCPLAMLRLGQIASAHNLKLVVSDPDALLKAVDILEDNLSAYINGFNGDESLCGTRVRQLYQYFQPEEYYAQSDLGSSENADKLFWDRYIGIATPEIFDNPDKASKKPIVQYFFGGIDGLLDFINKARADSTDEKEEDIINRILSNCPDKYGAAYRLYMATGEKLPLNED